MAVGGERFEDFLHGIGFEDGGFEFGDFSTGHFFPSNGSGSGFRKAAKQEFDFCEVEAIVFGKPEDDELVHSPF